MMAGDNGGTEDRVRIVNSLYEGPGPSSGFPVPEPPAADDEILRGESTAMPRRRHAMKEKPPPGMAVLTVSPQRPADDGSPQFALEGTCHCSPRVPLGTYGRPDLDLGTNLEPGGPQPAKFLDGMGNWSYTKTEVREWLNLHRHRHQGKFELVIRDVTAYRIPWELLQVPANQEFGLGGGYLGALLTVTRWVALKPQRPEYVKPFDAPTPYQAAGPVVAYIASDMEHDRDLLGDFDVDAAASMWHLFSNLAGESGTTGAVAMVYVACHSEFGDNPDDCALDRFTLGRATLFDDNLPRLRAQPTLVFLNGCRTGSVGFDVSRYNDRAVRGFAVVFLQSSAAGVLATTGAVGNEEAGKFAESLFAQLRADRSLSVARAVGRLRADAGKEIIRLLRADPELFAEGELDERLLPLLYSFMYVYYGSPWLLMSIASRGGSGEPGEQGRAGSGAE